MYFCVYELALLRAPQRPEAIVIQPVGKLIPFLGNPMLPVGDRDIASQLARIGAASQRIQDPLGHVDANNSNLADPE